MKFREDNNYLHVSIEESDWKTKGKIVLETIKSIPGRRYNPEDQSWRILKSQKSMLAEFLSPYTDAEELEGQEAIRDLMELLSDDTSYSL